MHNYVDNDVWKYRVVLNSELEDKDIAIYTKPFTDSNFNDEYDKPEDLVQERYFTKERIEELKQEFIKRIQECENPFNIYCVDKDGGYNVTEKELFDIGI